MVVWKIWSVGAARDVTAVYGVGGHPPVRGIVTWGDRRTTVDYPPMTLFGLGVLGRIHRTFDASERDSVAFTVLIKASILAAEALLTFTIWLLVVPSWGVDRARAAVLLYWLNPGAVMDGAVLGYLDAWAAAPLALGILAATIPSPLLTGAALAFAVMTKAQAILVVPVAALLLAGSGRARVWLMIRAAIAFIATMTIVVLPFALRGAVPNLLQGVSSLLRHDMLSATAANLWWIVTWILRAVYAAHDLGAYHAWTSTVRILGVSRVIELGYVNPRPIATLMAGAAMAWGFWRAYRVVSPGVTPRAIAVALASGAFAVHAYFVLSVQVHENHLYLVLPLLAAAAVGLPRLREPLAALSAIFALNLWLFYGVGRDFALPPRRFTLVDATVLVSMLNVIALVWHARRFAASASEETAMYCENTYRFRRASRSGSG